MHKLNVQILGPTSFVSTLNELKAFLKFNPVIDKLDKNSNVVLFHVDILKDKKQKEHIDKDDLIKICLGKSKDFKDLIKDPNQTLRDLIIFVNTICKFNNGIDLKKLENAIQTTTFEKMQNLENTGEFTESVFSSKTKKKVNFFYLGPNNNWKDKLSKDLINKMNTYYKEDLKRFGYEI